MANSKGAPMYSGKHSLLPPKIPFAGVSQGYADYVPNFSGLNASQSPNPREGHNPLRRTSSESLVNVIEEQPSWLDELLNEPETPVRRVGHRRSSSDSFAYIDTNNAFNINYTDQDEYRYKNLASIPSWTPQDMDHSKGAHHIPMYGEIMNSAKHKNRSWESPLNAMTHPGGVSSGKNIVTSQSSGPGSSSCAPHEADEAASTANGKYDSVESGGQDAKASPGTGRKDNSHAKPSSSETDTKRAKQYAFLYSVF